MLPIVRRLRTRLVFFIFVRAGTVYWQLGPESSHHINLYQTLRSIASCPFKLCTFSSVLKLWYVQVNMSDDETDYYDSNHHGPLPTRSQSFVAGTEMLYSGTGNAYHINKENILQDLTEK